MKTDPDILLRAARPEDAEMIAKLIYELAVYERAPEQCHATPDAIRGQLFREGASAEAIVAESAGAIVGYAIFFHNFSTWEAAPGLYLEDVYVRPTYRGKGIGKKLLTYLAALAVERGCKRFEWSCLDWNKPARDFYKSLGAQSMDEWVIYRTEGDALAKLAEAGQSVKVAPPVEVAAPEKKTREKKTAQKIATPPSPPGVVVVYTDGGAQPNPGVGAWAAILTMGDNRREITGGELATTNNRMELLAAINALETLKKPCKVQIYTDSTYVKNGITTWIVRWKRNGWKSSSGAVKNADLWRRLDELCATHKVEWKWLRGHAGHVENERADELCQETINRMVAETTDEQRQKALAKLSP